MVAWYNELCAGQWDLAKRQQQRMHAFKRASAILYEEGNLHGICGKALAACSSILIPNNRARRPYLPVREETMTRFRRIVDEQFPDMRLDHTYFQPWLDPLAQQFQLVYLDLRGNGRSAAVAERDYTHENPQEGGAL